MTKYQRFSLLYAICVTALLLTGCGGWTAEANGVISVLILAIPALVNIVVSFAGVIPQPVLDAITKWGREAVVTLQDVKKLISDYSAPGADQTGIVAQIQALLATVTKNLSTLLPDLHITNPTVQRLITLVVGELSALLGIIPVIQGKVTSRAEVSRLHSAVLDKDEFKAAFNREAVTLGPQFKI